MPWERGPLSPLFTRRFSDDVATSVKPCRIGLRDVLTPSPRIHLEPRPLPTALFSAVNKRIAKCRIHLEDDELRTKALNQFKVLISMDLQATQLGQSISNVLGNLDTAVDPLRVLRDATSNKATGTLLKRASAMWGLACWWVSNSFGTCFNQSEQNLCAYMNYLLDSGAAPRCSTPFGVPDTGGFGQNKGGSGKQLVSIWSASSPPLLHSGFAGLNRKPDAILALGSLDVPSPPNSNPGFISWFAKLAKVDFHACMHGSDRDKNLASSMSSLWNATIAMFINLGT